MGWEFLLTPLLLSLFAVDVRIGPSPSSTSSIAIDSSGTRIYVANPDSASVSIVDPRLAAKPAEIKVGGRPQCVALNRDERLLVVTLADDDALAVVDTRTLRQVGRIPVSAEPFGVLFSPDGRLVYVASSAMDRIDVVAIDSGDLVQDERGHVMATILVDPKPKGLALSADGARLYVTHLRSASVTVIDTQRGMVVQTISTGADGNMAAKILLDETARRAWVPHIRTNTGNPNLLFDSTVFPVVSVLDLDRQQVEPARRLDLSLGANAVNLPFDVALSLDRRRIYVAGLGSGDLTILEIATGRKLAVIDVGEGPRGIAISPDGRWAYVHNWLSSDLSIVDLQAQNETRRIPLTTTSLPAQMQRGRLMFYSSRSRDISRDRWMSCATCHFEGEGDGRTWQISGFGPRNTTSLQGLAGTGPFHWSADRDEIQDFEFTIRDLQAGTGLIRNGVPNTPLAAANAGRSEDLDALTAFVLAIPAKRSPYPSSAAGQAIFGRADVGCTQCHVPPSFTDRRRHDVGTGLDPAERQGRTFDTPSLRGLWNSAPYFHDGSAATLRDVLRVHGNTAALSASEIDALVAYLLAL